MLRYDNAVQSSGNSTAPDQTDNRTGSDNSAVKVGVGSINIITLLALWSMINALAVRSARQAGRRQANHD